ncbi:MAG TPA: hypothetical protein PK289_12735 [Bacteroidia bacterium]|nr:hypothetical protein [Bacteroidia bacterium]
MIDGLHRGGGSVMRSTGNGLTITSFITMASHVLCLIVSLTANVPAEGNV